jgi:hypothetical protein
MTKIKSRDIFEIPNNEHMICLAQLTRNSKEFWLMLCVKDPLFWAGPSNKGKCYIEEFKWADSSFHQIEDTDEITDLTRFCELHKLSDVAERANEMVECGLGHIAFQ